MIIIYMILILLFVLNIILPLIQKNKKVEKKEKNYNFYGEKNKYLLTKNELSFFYKLKQITDKYSLYLFPKVRLADIINTNNYSNFNKIKSKHIDFTICNKYCSPILFIELDDNSHSRYDIKENDIKKDYIMEQVKANLLRIKLNEIDYKLKYIDNMLMNNDIKTGS